MSHPDPGVERALQRARERDRDLEALRAALPDDPEVLDDGTWGDLDLSTIFLRADQTLTTPGELTLYAWLRTPRRDPEVLAARDRDLSALERDRDLSARLQDPLARLGRSGIVRGVQRWTVEPLPPVPPRIWIHGVLAAAGVGILATALVWGGVWWLCVFGAFFTNMIVHARARRQYAWQVDALRELGRLILCAERLGACAAPGFEERLGRLGALGAELEPVRRAAATLIPERGTGFDMAEGLYHYVSIALLLESRAYAAILRALGPRQPALRALFAGVGEIDALQSAAAYRASLPRRCAPEWIEDGVDVVLEGGVHPLLEGAVPNSLDLEGGSCFVTGSNMSGKSTFLRTVGLNAVLAQTLVVCTALRYRATRLRIRSSIAPADDLASGRSFYYAEAERLLQLIRAAEGEEPALCIVDELLRGTNSVERLAAGEEILRYLAEQRALVVVATHDLELVEQLQAHYTGYHFSDAAEGGRLEFDYTLRSGTPTLRNAIALLEQLGFPATLVERARRRAEG